MSMEFVWAAADDSRVNDGAGPRLTKVVATLDCHCHITQRMLEEADALALYHTYPHIDMYETGQRGAAILRRLMAPGAPQPSSTLVRVPLVGEPFPAPSCV